MNNEGSRGSSGSIVHSLCQHENSANERMKGMKDDQEAKPTIGDPGDQARDRAIESSRNPSFILHSFIRGPEVAPSLADRTHAPGWRPKLTRDPSRIAAAEGAALADQLSLTVELVADSEETPPTATVPNGLTAYEFVTIGDGT